jgi:hypothetical protein
MIKRNFNRGQSVVEVIIALAIFVIIAGSAVVTVIGSLSTSRLAEEETIATTLTVEGLEAAESIRNNSWDQLSIGDHGLDNSTGSWQFLGGSDLYDNKYNRVVNVSLASRDASGNVVDSGGSLDPDTKKITSTVNWNFTAARSNSVSMTTYLTNWQEATTTETAYTSCFQYCVVNSYADGTCRNNSGQCSAAGETNETSADQYCGTPPDNTCCCLP